MPFWKRGHEFKITVNDASVLEAAKKKDYKNDIGKESKKGKGKKENQPKSLKNYTKEEKIVKKSKKKSKKKK